MSSFHGTTRVRPLMFFLVFALLTGGCATVGTDFPTDPVRSLEIGTTTRDDVARTFGSPWRTGIESGDESWTYGFYHYRLFGESETRDLKIIFDARGRVQSYSFSQSGGAR